jgi:hypothetical protein
MKISNSFLPYLLFFFFIWGILPGALPAELIEPTRSLHAPEEKRTGLLSVFSEPPEISVSINGKQAGATPLVDLQIAEGVHLISIAKEKTEVYVPVGKSVRLSYFRGRFINLGQKPVGVAALKSLKEAPSRIESNPPKTEIQDKPLNSFYWPLNPTGPIY